MGDPERQPMRNVHENFTKKGKTVESTYPDFWAIYTFLHRSRRVASVGAWHGRSSKREYLMLELRPIGTDELIQLLPIFQKEECGGCRDVPRQTKILQQRFNLYSYCQSMPFIIQAAIIKL